MDSRFRAYRGILISFALLGMQIIPCNRAQGGLLDTLCQADANSPQVMTSLIEEAEATGMPSSTLNRLLIKGYHDRESIKRLSQLLCVIVQAEEEGLPPEPLFRKLDEGLGKLAPLKRIIAVVAAKVADMKYAQSLLSNGEMPKLDDDNVARLAAMLSSGLTQMDLNAIFDKGYDVPVEMRVVAAEIKGYGRAIGFDEPLIDRVITTGLVSRALSDDWTFFIKVVSEARKQNISDQNISSHAIKVLSQKGSLNDLTASLGLR